MRNIVCFNIIEDFYVIYEFILRSNSFNKINIETYAMSCATFSSLVPSCQKRYLRFSRSALCFVY